MADDKDKKIKHIYLTFYLEQNNEGNLESNRILLFFFSIREKSIKLLSLFVKRLFKQSF